MKNLLIAAVTLISVTAMAGTGNTGSAGLTTKAISSSKVEIASPSSIDQVIRLVDKVDATASVKKVSIVVEDHGMSTDVSPRYSVYLGYASLAEMGNIYANFKISDQLFKFISASRKSAGVYEVKFIEYRNGEMLEVTQTIDATKMFADEQKLRNSCSDFCDNALKTSVIVTETVKK